MGFFLKNKVSRNRQKVKNFNDGVAHAEGIWKAKYSILQEQNAALRKDILDLEKRHRSLDIEREKEYRASLSDVERRSRQEVKTYKDVLDKEFDAKISAIEKEKKRVMESRKHAFQLSEQIKSVLPKFVDIVKNHQTSLNEVIDILGKMERNKKIAISMETEIKSFEDMFGIEERELYSIDSRKRS